MCVLSLSVLHLGWNTDCGSIDIDNLIEFLAFNQRIGGVHVFFQSLVDSLCLAMMIAKN